MCSPAALARNRPTTLPFGAKSDDEGAAADDDDDDNDVLSDVSVSTMPASIRRRSSAVARVCSVAAMRLSPGCSAIP
jgi:hypothetical protein